MSEITISKVMNGYLIIDKCHAVGIENWDEMYIAKTKDDVLEVINGILEDEK